MMKKVLSLALAMVMMLAVFVCAQAEITVSKKDLSLNNELDKNVDNILVLLQDGGVTDTMMIASINGKTGRAVMTRVDCGIEVDVTLDSGETARVPLSGVYAMGAQKSQGLLAARELNELLGLNINTYVALDLTSLPAVVETLGTLNMTLSAQEAEALGAAEGVNALAGDAILSYVRLKLDTDSPARSRGYDALMRLLYQGLNSGNVMDLMGVGMSLLASMDTNLNVMSAMTMVTAVQGGTDRRELLISAETMASEEEMRAAFHREVYE